MIVLLFFIACAATRLHAQGYASIVGTVTDPTGAVIPSATVTAVQTQTGHATVVTAGKDGAYVFPALLPSTYSISVSAQGFEQSTQAGIVLQADQALTVNVKLNIGAATTTVEVESSVPQVNTSTGTLSQVVDEESVVDLPLNGRNAATLSTLVAGVVDATNEGNGVNQGNGKHTAQLGKGCHPKLRPQLRDNLPITTGAHLELVAIDETAVIIDLAIEYAVVSPI